MKVTVLRTSGEKETHDLKRGDLDAIKTLIGCTTIDTVSLTRRGDGAAGTVMIVDDDGYETEEINHGDQPDPRRPGHTMFVIERRCMKAKKPVNVEATKLYHHKCGGDNGHQIVGDVALVDDRDFE